MRITVRYHGVVGDLVERRGEEVELPAGATVAGLVAHLSGGDETRTAILRQARAFVAGHPADRTSPLTDGIEVTLMRPIAGG